VKFGIHLPNMGVLNGREPMVCIAQQAEAMGFDSLWTSDHIVLPDKVESIYPYGRSGLDPSVNYTDPLISLAVAAGCTERIELGTTVLILPYRNPLLTAKMLASLDMLSNGRLIVGAGTGWMREEFEALGLTYFAGRGKVTEEWIRIFRSCWEQDLPQFSGEHYQFRPVHFLPKPVRRIPIWMGGKTAAALRRAGRHGDGWHPARVTLAEIATGIETVKRHATAAGRDPEALEFSMGCVLDVMDDGPGVRVPVRDLMGTPTGIAAFVHVLERLGVTHLALDFRGGATLEAILDTMHRFDERVRPLL